MNLRTLWCTFMGPINTWCTNIDNLEVGTLPLGDIFILMPANHAFWKVLVFSDFVVHEPPLVRKINPRPQVIFHPRTIWHNTQYYNRHLGINGIRKELYHWDIGISLDYPPYRELLRIEKSAKKFTLGNLFMSQKADGIEHIKCSFVSLHTWWCIWNN